MCLAGTALLHKLRKFVSLIRNDIDYKHIRLVELKTNGIYSRADYLTKLPLQGRRNSSRGLGSEKESWRNEDQKAAVGTMLCRS